MGEDNYDENISRDTLSGELDAGEADLLQLFEKSRKTTQYLGFAVEAYRGAKANVISIADSLSDYPELNPVVMSSYKQAKAIRAEANDLIGLTDSLPSFARGIASTAYTFCASSDSVAGTINPQTTYSLVLPSFLRNDEEEVIHNFELIDPVLAETYQEIEQVYYATDADNIRAAISSTRQAFDHFFDKLAPDEDVRKSNYWKRKIGEDDELLVTRRERIIYAIHTHIRSRFRASTLEAEVNLIIQAYQGLNALHKRGRVNLNASKQALFTIKHFLEEFAEAIQENL